MRNSILLQEITPNQLSELIDKSIKVHFDQFKKELQKKDFEDELLSRAETSKLLKIDLSTLWHWTNKGKVKAYGIGNKRYYKRSEIIECIKLLKK
ncbi:helix-turn-helix domain-containing protein [Lutimonas saemankumensis]|uniref:helix-turn-helix domain-containing protein n=1 Tax=Lutimonas saemankumensis TaxID=483016 RepID=UPI001CD1C796|nr:helix-turn-helix domain-containing protein [Lutimonas saemankumensis]MCA0933092.1 helix-turn-helix domain-containing protein [Lutimonas saemankumensis]